jgi:hypothetical protein
MRKLIILISIVNINAYAGKIKTWSKASSGGSIHDRVTAVREGIVQDQIDEQRTPDELVTDYAAKMKKGDFKSIKDSELGDDLKVKKGLASGDVLEKLKAMVETEGPIKNIEEIESQTLVKGAIVEKVMLVTFESGVAKKVVFKFFRSYKGNGQGYDLLSTGEEL